MRLLLVLLVAVLAAAPADAHEVRPAYLEIRETAEQTFQVRFRQPIIAAEGGLMGGLNLKPAFPQSCTQQGEPLRTRADGYLTERFKTSCTIETRALEITIDGLQRSLTDVYVTFESAEGVRSNYLLNGRVPGFAVGGTAEARIIDYFDVGLAHMLGGIDHVLFVIGLVLLVPGSLRLVSVATTFAIAHSLTLALSALELVRLPMAPVEAGIALSVLFMAYELTRSDGTEASIARRHPELVAFGFGLLHGFGFAGVLADAQMPMDQLIPALFFFNVGVEAGQLLVIAFCIATLWALRQLGERAGVAFRTALMAGLTVGAAFFFAGAFARLIEA